MHFTYPCGKPTPMRASMTFQDCKVEGSVEPANRPPADGTGGGEGRRERATVLKPAYTWTVFTSSGENMGGKNPTKLRCVIKNFFPPDTA